MSGKTRMKKLEGGRLAIYAPGPGLWREAPDVGTVLAPGAPIGRLEVLGRLHALEVPAGAHGAVVSVFEEGRARSAVDYGTVLLELDPSAAGAAVVDAETEASDDAAGLAFVAPMSGRFYLRPSPDKPPFVTVGATLTHGQPVGLLEVMKTFNRVAYGGELPSPAKVVAIVAEDGADVSRGDVLLRVEKA